MGSVRVPAAISEAVIGRASICAILKIVVADEEESGLFESGRRDNPFALVC